VNLFVAAFIGSPSMNFVRATVERGVARFAGIELPVTSSTVEGNVVLGVRPTAFEPAGRPGWPTLTVVPEVIEDLGDERFVIFDVDAPRVDTEAVLAALDAGAAGDVQLIADSRARFTARLPGDAPVTLGQPLALSVDPGRLYFFDPDSGAALR
jgi:multiple sugar transport system ATP-binding protein